MGTVRSSMQEVENRRLTQGRFTVYLSLLRPVNCAMIGVAVVIGEVINLGSFPGLDKAAFGFLTASLMMAGTMVLNDIYDVDIDRLNAPNRPIPSGRASIGSARYLAAALSIASMTFAILIGVLSFLIALLALGLMIFYNTRGKRLGLLGNAVVSFNVALPFVFGGVSVSALRPIVVLFSVLAFLTNLGREIGKGVVDVEGDRLHNVRTLAVLKGQKFAAKASSGLLISAVAVSFVPIILGIANPLYVLPVAIADFGFVMSAVSLLRNSSPDNARRVKSWILLCMLFGLIAFLLGGLPVAVIPTS